mmetsp:Transcript_204/g.648  ORF Transcript_204/g.648 Transcript_204/m.648 type:complete len:174 (-) Transcript_204:63-584(-)
MSTAKVDMMRSEKVTPYRCGVEGCGKYFTRRFNLKAHVRCHTGARPFVCPFDNCNQSFKWKSSYASHLRSHRNTDARRRLHTVPSGHSRIDISRLLNGSEGTDDMDWASTSSDNDSVKSDTGFEMVVKVLAGVDDVQATDAEDKVLLRSLVTRNSIGAFSTISSPDSSVTTDM